MVDYYDWYAGIALVTLCSTWLAITIGGMIRAETQRIHHQRKDRRTGRERRTALTRLLRHEVGLDCRCGACPTTEAAQ